MASTACALLPDSYINFLHVHNKSCNWTVFKAFQDWEAQVQHPCCWDDQEGVWQQWSGVIWIFLHGRDKLVGDATSLPGWRAPMWWDPRETTTIYLLGIGPKATPLLPPSSTCHVHLVQFWYTTQRIRKSGNSKNMQKLVCLYLFLCLTHQKAQCPTLSVCKIRLPNLITLPLTSRLSNEQFHSGHNVLYIDNNSTSIIRLSYLQHWS